MEYGDFNLDEEQTKELNKNLDELSEKIDKYEREYDDRKVITDDLLTGLNNIEENLKNLINKADKIKVDEPKKDKSIGIIKKLEEQKNIDISFDQENGNNRITAIKLLKSGKQLVLGNNNGELYLYEISKVGGKEISFYSTRPGEEGIKKEEIKRNKEEFNKNKLNCKTYLL